MFSYAVMIKYYFHKMLLQPPHKTVKKAIKKICSLGYSTIIRCRDEKASSYETEHPASRIASYLHNLPSMQLSHYTKTGSCVTKHYPDHRFDLLGSGWVQVKHGMKCRGLEGYSYDMGESVLADTAGKWLEGRINKSNLGESQHIWQLIFKNFSEITNQKSDITYTPIDWQIDFKSGYRWAEGSWSRDIKLGNLPGVDVKVPWELARMQHLPQMAWSSLSLPEGSSKRSTMRREFRNQVLDFMATNPPRFGINWTCAMDVAIRASNWLLAYDLFCAGGSNFDDEFEKLFARSIYEHGLFIVHNLEWVNQKRGNHYLADIVGLSFIAGYLPSTMETDAWLAFAVQELINEVQYQFYPDGGNFEGSTAYHRFSSEMVYYATALILGLPQERKEKMKSYDYKLLNTGRNKPRLKPAPLPFYRLPENSIPDSEESPFPKWYYERMERMAEFIMNMTKPDGHIPQIGDNDSGRFFKLSPQCDCLTVKQAKAMYDNLKTYDELPDSADYYIEDQLNCRHLVAAASGLFDRVDFKSWLVGQDKTATQHDNVVIRFLCGNKYVGTQIRKQYKKTDNEIAPAGEYDFQKVLAKCHSNNDDKMRVTEIPVKADYLQGLLLYAYPDFGLYIYKNLRNFYLSIRCWSGRESVKTGHMHNDQLSVELWIAGNMIISDPGSYLYSPLANERNRYRSVHAHFTPWPADEEPACLGPGLFSIHEPLKARMLYFGKTGFTGEVLHQCGAKREMVFQEGSILIIDSANCPFNKVQGINKLVYSPGYGNRFL